MTATLPITYAQIGEVLAALRFGIGPSDLHGSLTGYLCGGGSADARNWLAALELEAENPGAIETEHAQLQQLFTECSTWLSDPDFGFNPLLPAADAPLDARADALVEWCRGFLGGIGLAGVAHDHGMSPDAEEILGDLGSIAGSRFEYDDSEEDENALSEVIEFIRVGVLLLHAELTAGPPDGARLH